MNVYKIGPDHKKSKVFIFPITSLLQSSIDRVPLRKIMDFYKFNLSLSGIWPSTEAIFNTINGGSGEIVDPDITTWITGTLVLSDKARNVLSCFKGPGEYLPGTGSAGIQQDGLSPVQCRNSHFYSHIIEVRKCQQ